MNRRDRSWTVWPAGQRIAGVSILLPALLFILVAPGCSTIYEVSVPEGHPARTDIRPPEHRPSLTLEVEEPVETALARSKQWADDELHEHEHEQDGRASAPHLR